MANRRVFQAQALTANGIAVAGLSRISFDAGYHDMIRSRPDGAAGVEDVDRSGLVIGVTIECTDVTKVNQLLAATPGGVQFYARESGAITYHKYATLASICVLTGMNLRLAKNADAVLVLRGWLAVTSGSSDLKDVLRVDDGENAGTLVYPVRLQRPNSADYDPGGGDTISPIHMESLEMSLEAQVIYDYADADVAVTAVDRVGWNPLQTTFTHKDATMQTGTPPQPDITAALMNAARGTLAVQLLGRGGAAGKTLTIRNLLFSRAQPDFGPEYGMFTLSGESAWRNEATVYQVNTGTKLFEIA
jgi:hypothetical protein